MEEFYQQGDLEKANGLPVSRFYCRQSTNVPKCQIGFINIIVCPLIEAFADYLPIPRLTECLHHNRAIMEKEATAANESETHAAGDTCPRPHAVVPPTPPPPSGTAPALAE